ncbi:hypothetical protein [Jatrophihabitans sp.]|jgi:hypothetical protein|uniref:hypothetical protein n=1 Tax=Jatrophihabitans sp. TaxID=1932789 RepID=UPI002EDFBB33
MRQAFAHDAELAMPDTAADGAPGAAITVALCGHWEHQPPCPLAPHHTRADRDGDTVRLRILFATEPERVEEVRRRIEQALRAGEVPVPDGSVADGLVPDGPAPDRPRVRWQLRHGGPAQVSEAEQDHAERLILS